jgi:2-polyprenyl-6-hydroxyphenyl methylase/3-demethylubiquinone-9 3-methyltransferase
MRQSANLLDQESHFAFGENWASYATLVTDARIEEAITCLRRLCGDLHGKRFLDIGCGSGLHSLAALRLGATEVVAVDIDPRSVATTRQLLKAQARVKSWSAVQASVFDLLPSTYGAFDVVYSWGVLHHTGDLYRALRAASALVRPTGQFVFAVYRRTRLCWFWRLEKRWYARASRAAQNRARAVYVGLFRLLYPITRRRSFRSYVEGYAQKRGMDFYHDVHDWLGGWPYESISPAETERFMRQLGMDQVQAFVHNGKRIGLFGSACDEYVYSRH